MSQKTKKKPFRLTIGHLIRWGIFASIVYSVIGYLGRPRTTDKTNILGDSTQDWSITLDELTSNYLSPQQKAQIDNIRQNPLVNQALGTLMQASGDWPAFIDQQIVEIKKKFVTNIYLEVIKNIDNSRQHKP